VRLRTLKNTERAWRSLTLSSVAGWKLATRSVTRMLCTSPSCLSTTPACNHSCTPHQSCTPHVHHINHSCTPHQSLMYTISTVNNSCKPATHLSCAHAHDITMQSLIFTHANNLQWLMFPSTTTTTPCNPSCASHQ
jgi:hypothetical protein